LIFKEISSHISIEKKGKKPFIVGVNGIDASGKTTFAKELKTYLQKNDFSVQLLHIDDFHNPKKIRYDGINEIEAYYNNAFNYKQLLKEILIPLKNDEEINKTITCLELDKDKYCKEIEYIIDRNDIVIIEGVLLFREPILNYIDIKIFLDIGYDEVIKRAEIRDVPKYGGEFLKKYINKYIPIQKKYIKEYKPKIISDFVVDNTNFNRPVLI